MDQTAAPTLMRVMLDEPRPMTAAKSERTQPAPHATDTPTTRSATPAADPSPSGSAPDAGTPATVEGGTNAPRGWFAFERQRTFWIKTALLAATTIALVPILLWQHEVAATVYLIALIVVHVGGIIIIALGTQRKDIAPDTRGLWIRISALVILGGLLYLVTKGLESSATSFVFWGTLFAIWALHTLGLLLLHLKGRRDAGCPFA